MLIDGYAVETELGGELELVEIAVVELVPLLRIEVAVRQDHPGGTMLVGEVHVQIGIGHEMKHEDFHRRLPHVFLAADDCTWLGMFYQRRADLRFRAQRWSRIRAATAHRPASQVKPFLRSTLLAQPPTR